jgi:UDP-N-acetylglucosamine pyrophosphorylase
LQIIGVDNAIGKVLDPLFIGYTAEHGFYSAIKTVEREKEDEPVGVVLQKNG